MPLTMRLKPGERLIINGGVVRNASNRTVALEVLNIVTTLHERDLMLPEQADTPLRAMYFQIQVMHLEPENHDRHYRAFIDTSAQFYAARMQEDDAATCALVTELISLVGERSYPAALRRMQKEIGRPGDTRTAGAAAAKPEAVETEN